MYNPVTLARKVILHALKSRSKYDLHSPFVYRFYADILKDRSAQPAYRSIEKLRSLLVKDHSYLRRTDLGTNAPEVSWESCIRKVSSIALHDSVPSKYGRLLFRIAAYFKPGTIIELGTSLGISTSYLATGNPKGSVITIEGCHDTASFAGKTFSKLGLVNVMQVTGNFDKVLPGVLSDIEYPGMVFFDGNHQRDATLNYFNLCMQYIRNDSVFIFDDIHWSKGMEDAWSEIKKDPRATISIDLFRMGIVFFRKELSKEDFMLRF
jgi:predicted O-methyltransferase YrrM